MHEKIDPASECVTFPDVYFKQKHHPSLVGQTGSCSSRRNSSFTIPHSFGNCGGTRGFTIFSLNKTFPKWGEMVQEGNVHLVEEARVTRLCV